MDSVETRRGRPPGGARETRSVRTWVDPELYADLLDLCARNSIPLSRFMERALELAVELVKGRPSPLDGLPPRRHERVP